MFFDKNVYNAKTQDVARHFGISPYTVRARHRKGQLRAIKFGGRYFYNLEQAEADMMGFTDETHNLLDEV